MLKESNNTKRLLNFFFERVNEHYATDFYAVRCETYEVSIQGNYMNGLLGYLKRKRFDIEVSNSGYIRASKQFGNIKVIVVLT
jgi:hypothetical protein